MQKLSRIVVVLAVAFVFCACSLIYDAPALDSCASQQDVVPVDFALSFERRPRSDTKASGDITELNITAPSFRGISAISIIPFGGESGPVEPGDWTHNETVVMPQIDGGEFAERASVDGQTYYGGLVDKNYSHLYSGETSFLPLGTSRVLAYGYAVPVDPDAQQSDKHLNGSWEVAGLTGETIEVDKITFSPERIFSGVIPESAQIIVDVLNDIAVNGSYSQTYCYLLEDVWKETSISVRWDAITSPELQSAFKEFTNNGEMTTGAGKNVAYLLSRLYNTLKNYTGAAEPEYYKHREGTVEYDAFLDQEHSQKLTYNYMYLQLRKKLLDSFNEIKESEKISITKDSNENWVVSFVGDPDNYPVSLGLPSGSAVIRWNGSRFEVVTEGMEGLASVKNFCYMPPLCYYANSAVKTSSSRSSYEYYTDEKTWDDILSKYPVSSVNKTTRSVALVERLSYAPAMLVATIQASSTMLADNDGNPTTYCLAEGKNFPVTGVIIGGQYRQRFDFTVDTEAVEEFYLYDKHVSGVYLTAEQPKEMVMTLVFPTKEEKDVYFLLELRNDSKYPFHGADGIILPGGYFYLSGVLEKPQDLEDYDSGNPEQQECVFERDHYTIAHCKVETLENAMSTIPQLGDPQLILGIQTEQRWVYSYGSYVILE